MGAARGGRGEAPVVRHESESVVDLDAAKEGFECIGEPIDTPFDGVHPHAGASCLQGDLVQRLDLLFKHSKSLAVLLCDI
jgi:hypothetical protein